MLTGDEFAWVQDGTRDGEEIRHWMEEEVKRELERTGRKYVLLRGTHEERMKTAIEAVNKLISN